MRILFGLIGMEAGLFILLCLFFASFRDEDEHVSIVEEAIRAMGYVHCLLIGAALLLGCLSFVIHEGLR